VIPDRRTLERDFPILSTPIGDRSITYLDSAATSLMPRPVVEAMARSQLELCGAVFRGQHLLADRASEAFEVARQQVAAFIGCAADEIVFVRNATDGVNLLAQSLDWHSGDVVIVGAESHHSTMLPWRRAARTRTVPLDADGGWDLDCFAQLLQLGPRLVALTHASNVTGIYQPVERLAAMARAAGALVLLDASQSIPHRRIDVAALDVDFLVFSAHKMLGPAGIGVLYVRRSRYARLTPMAVGGGSVHSVTPTGFARRPGPAGLEPGTPNLAAVIGLAAAIGYLDRVGEAARRDHDRQLADALYEGARQRSSFLRTVAPSPTADRAAILSFSFVDARADDIARMLSDGSGIMCRSGHLCAQPLVDAFDQGGVLRASAYIYNSEAEIARFFAALDGLVPHLSSAIPVAPDHLQEGETQCLPG
jgi:cysteine desulfurase / selenocysteine lyase